MTKQPTRLADFDIPREQATKADGQPAGDLVPTAAPTPAFLQPEVRAALQNAQSDTPLAKPPSLEQATAPVPFPQPKAPAQEEPRRQLAARVRLSVAERLRTFLFVERESQQDAVEAALDTYLRERGY
jgi:hypothetical protein